MRPGQHFAQYLRNIFQSNVDIAMNIGPFLLIEMTNRLFISF